MGRTVGGWGRYQGKKTRGVGGGIRGRGLGVLVEVSG